MVNGSHILKNKKDSLSCPQKQTGWRCDPPLDSVQSIFLAISKKQGRHVSYCEYQMKMMSGEKCVPFYIFGPSVLSSKGLFEEMRSVK